jgi:pseudouridine-5'-phosphate glycosidase
MDAPIEIADEIRAALAAGGAVVALESTIVAHGLPHPLNLEVARELEAIVRRGGAVPATIAVVDGVARIGLDDAALARMAAPDAGFAKAGAADLAVALALGRSAATTVGATSWLAARAGIRVFATGGIGGVHRGDGGDVSNDLEVMARTPIAVVSAGPKAILDLPRTAELLESLGVLVVGYRTAELPAFYCRGSGVRLDHRVERPAEIARVLRRRLELAQGGVLVANPIPPAHAIPDGEVAVLIAAALAEAERAGVRGKAVTPFLLAKLAGLSGGRTLEANRALVTSNAELAAAIAVAFAAGA